MTPRLPYCSWLILLGVGVFAALTLGACQKVALLAPTESTVTVFAADQVLQINGSTQITASVIEQAGTQVHDGTLVTFTTNLGRLSSPDAQTRGGSATVTFEAGSKSGIAEIRAYSGSAIAEPVLITIGAAGAATLLLTANPGTVPSTGGTVQLVATVNDDSGNRLVGIPVSFTADAGTLGSSTATTDGNGEARTSLTTDRATTVTANAGGQSATATVAINDPPTVTLTPPTDPTAGRPATFTVAVTPGDRRVASAIIDFGDGQTQSLGALNGSSTVNHTYATAGTFVASVTVTDAGGEQVTVSTSVVVNPAVPINVTLSATPSPATIDEAVVFAATVTGSTVPIASYAWDFGDASTVTTTGNQVTHVYSSAGTVTVKVTVTNTDGVSGSSQLSLVVVPFQLVITLTANPSSPIVGQDVFFTATVTPRTVVVDDYDWVFGDGATLNTGANNTTQHGYTAMGAFTVTVTATTSDNETVATSALVTVQ